jgi:hypothetical protein
MNNGPRMARTIASSAMRTGPHPCRSRCRARRGRRTPRPSPRRPRGRSDPGPAGHRAPRGAGSGNARRPRRSTLDAVRPLRHPGLSGQPGGRRKAAVVAAPEHPEPDTPPDRRLRERNRGAGQRRARTAGLTDARLVRRMPPPARDTAGKRPGDASQRGPRPLGHPGPDAHAANYGAPWRRLPDRLRPVTGCASAEDAVSRNCRIGQDCPSTSQLIPAHLMASGCAPVPDAVSPGQLAGLTPWQAITRGSWSIET